ncbi:hypothetical protein JOC49_001787 [Fusibacter tunisiensis]|uniref:PPM-type phosphatase domain-containing protein n=2 Tax=Fusibacter tunisiensis TaxID=1008308 RepID=A0ABS2MS77_9FIRM|nr:hypothetical protein [Fusibacter tunisiensis]
MAVMASASVTGKRHVLQGTPNQDAVLGCTGHHQFMVLADGHGGEKHHRSKEGANLAIESVVECLEALWEEIVALPSLDKRLVYFENTFSLAVCDKWLEKVEFNPEPFGCTLLVAVWCEEALYFLQLGDGRSVVVLEDGAVIYPISEIERMGGETDSLAMQDAWLAVRIGYIQEERQVVFAGLFSDGVTNAYPSGIIDETKFYRAMASVENPDDLENHLTKALEIAESYSKDDASGIVYRPLNCKTNAEVICDNPCIVTADYPSHWRPVSELLAGALMHKKIEIAQRIAIGNWKNAYSQTELSIKRLFLDERTQEIHFMCRLGTEAERLALIQSFFEPYDFGTVNKETLNQYTIDQKRKLAYCFVCGVSYIGHCPICGCENKSGIEICSGNGTFKIQFDTKIFLHHLMPLKGTFDPLIGEIVQHPKDFSVWGIVNRCNFQWEMTSPIQKNIKKNEVLKLIHKEIVLNIGGIPTAIRFV